MPDRWIASAAILALALTVPHVSSHAAPQLGSRPTEEWIRTLEQPSRVATLKVTEIIASLRLKPGDNVADIGAGPGVFSLPLASAVSPGGTVYAVEVEQAFLDHIDRKVREASVANVVTVLGRFANPNLPARNIDLAFFHDVLHHVEDRAAYLKAVARYLSASGRIAVIELASAHRDQPGMQVTEQQVTAWMADAGLKPAEKFDLLSDKWFVVYSRP